MSAPELGWGPTVPVVPASLHGKAACIAATVDWPRWSGSRIGQNMKQSRLRGGGPQDERLAPQARRQPRVTDGVSLQPRLQSHGPPAGALTVVPEARRPDAATI